MSKPSKGSGTSRSDPKRVHCNLMPAPALRKMVEARRYHAAVGSRPNWGSLAREVSAAVTMIRGVQEFHCSPLKDRGGMEITWTSGGEWLCARVLDLRQVDEGMVLVREVMES